LEDRNEFKPYSVVKRNLLKKKDITTIYICENYSENISCPENIYLNNSYLKKQIISIENAIYGRLYGDNNHCLHESMNANNKCYIDLTAEINNQCNEKSSCTIYSSYSYDPCPNVYKYFEIKYYCNESTVTDKVGYYLFESNQIVLNLIDDSKDYAIYHCNTNGMCNQPSITGRIILFNYNKILINCVNNTKCSKDSTSGYFLSTNDGIILETVNDYNTYDLYNCNNGSCIQPSSYVTGKIILYNNNNILIDCSNNSCKKDNSSNSSGYFLLCESDGRVLMSVDDTEQHDLYRCNSNANCEKETITGYILLFKNNNGIGTLFECNGNSCSKKQNPNEGYYVNKGNDSNTKPLIKCENEGNCVTVEASTNGYYLHGESSNLSNVLIHCSSNTSCDNPSTVNFNENEFFKYYMNNGSDNKSKILIECSKNEKRCLTKIPASTIGYYLHGEGKNLIYCIDSMNCRVLENIINFIENDTFKYFINNGLDSEKYKLIECSKSGESEGNCYVKEVNSLDEYTCDENGICLDNITYNLKCDVNTGKNCELRRYHLFNISLNFEINRREGRLFFCNEEDTKCTEIYEPGYYINDSKTAFQCKDSNGSLRCSTLSYRNNCQSTEDVGMIFKNNINEKIYLCLNYYQGESYILELNSINSGSYILKKNDDNDIFDLGSTYEYAFVNISDRAITLNTTCKFYYFLINILNNNYPVKKKKQKLLFELFSLLIYHYNF